MKCARRSEPQALGWKLCPTGLDTGHGLQAIQDYFWALKPQVTSWLDFILWASDSPCSVLWNENIHNYASRYNILRVDNLFSSFTVHRWRGILPENLTHTWSRWWDFTLWICSEIVWDFWDWRVRWMYFARGGDSAWTSRGQSVDLGRLDSGSKYI